MSRKGFARLLIVALPTAASWTPLRGQEGGAPPAADGFQPEYIDTAAYRGEQILLYDWPELTRLVRWSAPVAEAIAREDGTLSADLLEELRERVDTLEESEPPAFLAARRDSVRSILDGIQVRLDAADSMLAEIPPAEVADPTGEERANVSDRDRTYATGPTAVRVPAGIEVGDADSLPGASIDGAVGAPTYVDLVSEALVELDGLVHLVRRLGEPPSRDP